MPANVLDGAFIDAQVDRLLHETAGGGRYLLGITGIPGSGKSTLAAEICSRINVRAPDAARLVPMDGFHLTNRRLDELGLRQCKGAPQTFDAARFIELLRAAKDPTRTLQFLVYDRNAHEPVMTGLPEHVISPRTRIVITEGNYLLLNREPWRQIHRLLTACWRLEIPLEQAKRRLIERHVRGGRSRESAAAWFESNDAANARLVLEGSLPADVIVRWPDGTD